MSEPRCSLQELLDCQFNEWYSKPPLKAVSIKSEVIALGEEEVAYLRGEGQAEGAGLVLPKSFDLSVASRQKGAEDGDWSDEEDDGDDGEDGEGEEPCRPQVDFPLLAASIKAAIERLGGSVFPKLNWSSPRDAAWVNGGSLRCRTGGDILCLLRSSVFISHDLHEVRDHAFLLPQDEGQQEATTAGIEEGGEGTAKAAGAALAPIKYTLVLRKWCNLQSSMLFRCFVKGGRLVGVSQRDCTSFYAFLVDEVPRLQPLISGYFETHIRNNFAHPNYIFDVYIDRKDRCWLLDFNVFAAITDSLLFDWAELAAADVGEEDGVDGDGEGRAEQAEQDYEFRVVPTDISTLGDSMAQYRGPSDMELMVQDPQAGFDFDAFRQLCDKG